MNRRRIAGTFGLAIVMALALGALVPVSAFAAAATFTGGPDQWPIYALNDHTPMAVHFTADPGSGLAPNTSYYLKVRFTVGTTPSGLTNRGYTWNPVSQSWVQERDAWSLFPTVTTDGSGAISSNAGWTFTKFGDDTKSGPYHVMISLSATGDASTFNGSIVPTVTILDPRTGGGWVHNGTPTGKSAATRALVTDETSTTVFATQKTEAQGVDDDSNGITDDEDFGPTGSSGDFRMGVPALTAIAINLNRAIWVPGNGFVSGQPDVDLAISANDTVAPTAPAFLVAESGDSSASLTWTGSTDNGVVAGYYVYRWSPAPLGAAYSPVHSRIATVGPSETSFVDSGLINGSTYLYEVRAYDTSSNVGPRSTTVTATPAVSRPGVQVTPGAPDGDGGWYVTAPTVELQPGSGRTSLYSFEPSPSTWTTYTGPISVPSGLSTLTYCDTDGVTMSATGTIDFKADPSLPTAAISAPAFSVLVSKSTNFRVSWGGADALSGIAAFDVQYKNGASGTWTLWRGGTAATSAVFWGAPGANYYFRVCSYDNAGNASPWTEAKCTVVPYDHTKARFSSGWSRTRSSSYYLGSARYTTRRGASATVGFTKGTLYLITKTGPKLGKVAVYYRGKRIKTINLYSRTTKSGKVFTIISRSSGTKSYPVKLVNLGTSGRRRVEIDGFALKR